jgi:ATP-binding cassette, subfamily B, bacterial MsbA
MTPGQVYLRLLRYALAHKRLIAIGIFGMLLFASVDAGFAVFTKYFIRDAFVEFNPRVVWAVPLGLLAMFLIRGVGDYLGTFFPGRVGRHIIKSLRSELFAKYLRLPSAHFDRETGPQMLSRLTFNVEQVAVATTNSVKSLITDTLTLLALLAWMLYLSVSFTLLTLIAAPLIAWIMKGIARRFRRYSDRIQQSMADVTRVSKEAIEGQRAIKVFNAESAQAQRFDEVNEHNRRSHEKLINAHSLSSPVVQLVAASGLALVLYVAISRVARNQVTVDVFLSYLAAMMLLMPPLRRMVNVSSQIQQGIAAASTIFAVLDAPAEDQGGSLPLSRARGEIEFRNVDFAYSKTTESVLADINLRVAPGQTLAIVGRSGGGKSTLVGLVPRFYDAVDGAVLLDGQNIRDYPLADLRRQISYVSQDVVLFDDSIRANILFGQEGIAQEKIEQAARAAHVWDFAQEMPQGLDSLVGDRGALLSGGQRQRVAIARAILKDAPILILDEATSALDSESERYVQEALQVLMRGRTTLVIAHRLSTVEHADQIAVLDAGNIVERGTHAELLARGGLYAQLHQLQFNA